MKKIIMLIGLIVVIGIGVFAFTGGTSDSSDVTTLLNEYESKTDEMIKRVKSGEVAAIAEYTTWGLGWSKKWEKAIKNMDASELEEFKERYNKIINKWTESIK